MDNKSFQHSLYFTTRAAAASSNTNNMDHYLNLRQLNNHSHNISKPNTKKFPFDPSKNRSFNYNNHYYLTHPQLQPPPPVYNVTKHEFKEVVQRLTGSPSHNHTPIISMAPPPPIHKPKPPSTRLQRVRPPPLAQISNRSVMMLNNAFAIPSSNNHVVVAPPFSPLPPFPSSVVPTNPVVDNIVAPSFSPLPPFPFSAVPTSNPVVVNDVVAPPFSPLPPLPSVCRDAESPVSAYMRFLNSSVPTSPPSILFSPTSEDLTGFSQLVPSPMGGGGWNGL